MATVDAIVKFETGVPFMESVRCDLTATGTSTYITRKFARIHSVFVVAEGTNGATYTWAIKTVTITGTADDHVNIIIIGYK